MIEDQNKYRWSDRYGPGPMAPLVRASHHNSMTRVNIHAKQLPAYKIEFARLRFRHPSKLRMGAFPSCAESIYRRRRTPFPIASARDKRNAASQK